MSTAGWIADVAGWDDSPVPLSPGRVRLRALAEIAASRDPEAFDQAHDVVGAWPRDERREGTKVLLQALAERRLTAASLLEDRPLDVALSGGLYGPQNYDRGFKGTVSVRTALASSLNVPAVRTAQLVTPGAMAKVTIDAEKLRAAASVRLPGKAGAACRAPTRPPPTTTKR